MQREQIGKLYGELEKYHEIISFVGLGSKSKKDIIAYLMSIDISESTSKRYVREISQGKVDLLMCDEEENVMINKDVYFEFLNIINSSVKSDNQVSKSVELAQAMGNIKTTTGEKDAVIAKLKKEKEELQIVISTFQKEITVLKEEKQAAIEESENAKKKSLEQPILILSSEKLLPLASDWEKQFVPKVEEEVVEAAEPKQESTDEKTGKEKRQPRNEVETYILNKVNYVRQGIQKVLTDSFMLQKIKELLAKQGQKEFVPEKPYVENLLAEGSYTNQQKLALYAAFSEYRHTDFEKLLNFAGDNNVNADLLIQWVESLGDEQDFKQIKNALRQFAKPAEYQMKYELARELLLGHWQVEFLCKGVPERFRLVSENDIAKVKEMLGLSDDAFTYHDYVTYEMEAKAQKEKREKEAAMVKKKELDRVQIKAPDFIKRFIIKEVDIDDYDLEEDAVDYKEMKQEDAK